MRTLLSIFPSVVKSFFLLLQFQMKVKKIKQGNFRGFSTNEEGMKIQKKFEPGTSTESSKPLVKTLNGQKWFESQYNDVSTVTNEKKEVEKFENDAFDLLQREIDRHEKQRQKRKPGEASWMKTVSAGGTLGDKIAALILQIQESPLHNSKNLELLISKVERNNRREAILAAESLKDLFLQDLLPDRKLTPFKLRPLSKLDELSSGNRQSVEKRLILWYFEEQLRKIYETFVKQIEKLCHDTVEATRLKASEILLDLIIHKSEQEKFILASLVNKLGDSSYKIASKIVSLLLRLVLKHPNMNSTVAGEVEKLLYRPKIALRAQYYGVLFLSQITLRRNVDNELSLKLLNIYINLFKLMVDKGLVDNKMLAILLNGTNRAFPLAKGSSASAVVSDVDTLYKVVAVGNVGTSLQALLLLLQVLEASEGVNERFYCTFYRKLLDPALESGAHHHAFLFHLLFKTLKTDTVETRIVAFLKRLLQICLHASPTFICSSLVLFSELKKEKPLLLKLEKNAQNPVLIESDDEDVEHFVDVHGPDSEAEFDNVDHDVQPNITPSWIHQKNVPFAAARKKYEYDPNHRNPMFANAESSLQYELLLLKNHYHPTVALFAQNILNNESIEYEGDPLQDFTLIRFLDRFVYRNPKKPKQSNKNVLTLNKRKTYNPWGVKKLSVTSTDYAQKTVEEIPVDEQYLHKYMANHSKSATGDGSKRADDDDDNSSVDSDAFEELIDKFDGNKRNEDFKIDYSRGLTKEKKKKRKAESSSGEDDDDEGDDEEYDENFGSSRKNKDVGEDFNTAEEFGELLENATDDDDDDDDVDGKKKRKFKHKNKKRFKR